MPRPTFPAPHLPAPRRTAARLPRLCKGALAAGLALGLSACASLGSLGIGETASTPKPADVIDVTARNAALTAEAARDYKAAAGSWATLYQRHPDDPAGAVALARNLRYSGQVQAAIDVCSGFGDRHGPVAPVLTELGKDYLAADRLPLAVRTLQQAAQLAPKDWSVQSALGVAFDYQKSYTEAQQAYNAALALSPDNPLVLNNLGLSQAEAGQLHDAEETLSRAANQPHATAQVRQNLALIKALSGDLDGAERLSRQDLTPEMARSNASYYRLLAGASRVP